MYHYGKVKAVTAMLREIYRKKQEGSHSLSVAKVKRILTGTGTIKSFD